jgi:hypothetical protein
VDTQKNEHLSEAKRAALAKLWHARLLNSAMRAADDPALRDRAARVVRAALATGKLSWHDLEGPVVKPRRDSP